MSFNPTLVRLRLADYFRRCFVVDQFQSHAGSIEAGWSSDEAIDLALFQSHAGSIEAPGIRFPISSPSSFQSHAGSIEAREENILCQVRKVVSIPRWFD